jgi:prepilin-type N-terminal cleavage/methylation domain-containing protein
MLTRLTKAMNKKDKGFTLIELLVVIIIIGILSAIAIPIFLSQRKKGVDASIKSDLKQYAVQVETYYTDNQTYPPSVVAGAAGTDVTLGASVTGATTGTVTVSPGNVLVYTLDSTGTYKICGWNTGGTATSSALLFKYDSASGGLMPDKQTSC